MSDVDDDYDDNNIEFAANTAVNFLMPRNSCERYADEYDKFEAVLRKSFYVFTLPHWV